MILFKISAFIWEINFNKTRMIYYFVIRSIMTYVSSMWHSLKQKRTNIKSKLTILQNKNLRTMTRIFRITLVSILKVEIYIVLMNIHFNQLQTFLRLRLQIEFTAKFITNSCKNIVHKFHDRTNYRRNYWNISKELKNAWFKKQLIISIVFLLKKIVLVSWSNHLLPSSNRDKFIKQRKREIKEFHETQWKKKWATYLRIVANSVSTQTDLINKKRFKLHALFRKAKSSLTTQIRTKKIDFANFLHRRSVLEIDPSMCRCE